MCLEVAHAVGAGHLLGGTCKMRSDVLAGIGMDFFVWCGQMQWLRLLCVVCNSFWEVSFSYAVQFKSTRDIFTEPLRRQTAPAPNALFFFFVKTRTPFCTNARTRPRTHFHISLSLNPVLLSAPSWGRVVTGLTLLKNQGTSILRIFATWWSARDGCGISCAVHMSGSSGLTRLGMCEEVIRVF